MRHLHHKAAYLTLTAIAVALLAATFLWSRRGSSGLPYQDHFAKGSIAEWTTFGGDWHVVAGAIRNDSNDRGTKLLTGSSGLKDYELDSDVLLTSAYGDAGIVFRVTEPELGANAFYGYYAGIRLPDQVLLGKMDLGFRPIGRVILRTPFTSGTWYHLRVTAQGCRLNLEAADMRHNALANFSVTDSNCYERGNFGLRSFESGGMWRNIQVRAIR